MATHFNILAWRIPGTEEPGGLPSMGLHRVGHDLVGSNLAAAAAAVVCLKRQQAHTQQSIIIAAEGTVEFFHAFFFISDHNLVK